MVRANHQKVFGLSEWTAWLDTTCRSLFGMSAAEFESAYQAGTIEKAGVVIDIASVLPLIRRLRATSAKHGKFSDDLEIDPCREISADLRARE